MLESVDTDTRLASPQPLTIRLSPMRPNPRSSLRSFPVAPDEEIIALQQRLDALRDQLYWTVRTVNQTSHEAHRKALAALIHDLKADIAALTAKRAMHWRQTPTGRRGSIQP